MTTVEYVLEFTRRVPRSALVAMVAGLLVPTEAFAYIDPNAGGWLYQLLFPVLIAIAGAWAILRQKIAQILKILAERIRGR